MACRYSRSRGQQVLSLLYPSFLGNDYQGQPLLSTKRIAVNAAQFQTGGRRSFGLSGSEKTTAR